MSFIDSYKQLEKICNEIYKNNHGVSAYIDEMMSISFASRYVSSWKDDLKRLKHYRWVRNQIVHEPGCTEENMCDTADIQWLNNFYARIMTGNDPLALYRKATKPQKIINDKCDYVTAKQTACYKPDYFPEQQDISPPNDKKTNNRDKNNKSSDGIAVFLGVFFIIVVVVLLVVGLS